MKLLLIFAPCLLAPLAALGADSERPNIVFIISDDHAWKLLLTYDGKVGRYGRYHPRTEKRPQLLDLLADPHEETNVAADHPEVVARLAAKLDQWWPVADRQVLTKWSE